jgi:hypothetical protein
MTYNVTLTFGHTTRDGALVPREQIAVATAYLGRLLYHACGGARVWEHGGFTGNGNPVGVHTISAGLRPVAAPARSSSGAIRTITRTRSCDRRPYRRLE